MKVLSLFDGLGGCRIALDRLGVEVEKYYSSEIDKYAMQVCSHNYPDTIHLGSVCDWQEWEIEWDEIDLVTGGFPCQAWSIAGKQLGDKDERGMLFWTMLDVMKKVLSHNPKAKFLIENVKMKKEFEDYITHHTEQALGHVEKILINSALVSAQNRNRWYWHNLGEVQQPEDKGLVLADVIDICGGKQESVVKNTDRNMRHVKNLQDKSLCMTATMYKGAGTNGMTLIPIHGGNIEPKVLCGAMRGRYIVDGKRQDHKMKTAGLTEQRLEIHNDGKTNALTTVQKDNYVVEIGDRVKGISENERGFRPHKGDEKKSGISEMGRILKPTADKTDTVTTSHAPKLATNSDIERLTYRKLTPLECERLQTLPDNYTLVLGENGKQLVSNTQRYKMIGNGWTIDVICHLLKSLKKD